MVALLAAVAAGCSSGGCSHPHGYKTVDEYRKAEMGDRLKKVQPVLDALEQFRTAQGKYPEKLDDLIAAKLIDALPEITSQTDHQGKDGRIHNVEPPKYETNPDRSEFTISVIVRFSELGS